MGNTTTHHPVFLVLQELLHEKGLRVKKRTIDKFMEAVETYAPWFPVSGHLTLASWDKLGRDLDFAFDRGDLGPGVRPLWGLVRSCILDQSCEELIESGQNALQCLQEERSQHGSEGKGASGPQLQAVEDSDSNDSGDEDTLSRTMS